MVTDAAPPRTSKLRCRSVKPSMKLLVAEHHRPTLEHLTGLLAQAGHSVRAVTPSRPRPSSTSSRTTRTRWSWRWTSRAWRASHLGPLLRGERAGRAGAACWPSTRGTSAGPRRGRGARPQGQRLPRGPAAPRRARRAASSRSRPPRAQGQPAPARGALATLGRPPVASGELKGFPLPALLHSIYRLQRDGILVVARRDLTPPRVLRRRQAGELRLHRPPGLAAALPRGARRARRRPGGAAQPGAGLRAAHRRGARRGRRGGGRRGAAAAAARLHARPRGPGGRHARGPLRLLRRGRVPAGRGARGAARAGSRCSRARAAPSRCARSPEPLRPHLAAFPVRTPDFGKDLPALALDTEDLKVALQINGRIALRDLLAHGRGDLRRSYSLLWFLAAHRRGGLLAHGPRRWPRASSGPGTAPTVIAPRKRKPLPAATAAALRDAAVRIITGSYFHGLGPGHHRGHRGRRARLPRGGDALPPGLLPRVRHLGDPGPARHGAGPARRLVPGALRGGEAQGLPAVPLLAPGRGPRDGGERGRGDPPAQGEAALKRGDARSAPASSSRRRWRSTPASPSTTRTSPGPPTSPAAARARSARARRSACSSARSRSTPTSSARTSSRPSSTASLGDLERARKLLKVLELNPYSQLAKAALRKVGR